MGPLEGLFWLKQKGIMVHGGYFFHVGCCWLRLRSWTFAMLLQCLVVLWYVLVGIYGAFDVFAMSPS